MRKILICVVTLIVTSCVSKQEKVERAISSYLSDISESYVPIEFGNIQKDNYKIWYNDSIQELSRIIHGLKWSITHNVVYPHISDRDTAFTKIRTGDDKRYYLIMYRQKIDDFELLINKIDTTQTGYKVVHRYDFGTEMQNTYFVDKTYNGVITIPDFDKIDDIISLTKEINKMREEIDFSLIRLRLNEK